MHSSTAETRRARSHPLRFVSRAHDTEVPRSNLLHWEIEFRLTATHVGNLRLHTQETFDSLGRLSTSLRCSPAAEDDEGDERGGRIEINRSVESFTLTR